MDYESKDKYMNGVPTFWELEFHLKYKLIKDFSIFFYGSIKFKHWVMFFSFWALALQTRTLLNQYLVFDTVVKVEMTRPDIVFMPGVTICTDKYHMVLKKKLAARYPEILEEISSKNLTGEEEMQVYRRYKQIAYDNSTVDQWFKLMVEPHMVLTCKLTRMPVWHRKRNITEYPDCYNMSEVMYTLPMGAGICWTFFSEVNPRDYHTRDWVIENDWYTVDLELGILASYNITFQAFYDNEFVVDVRDERDDDNPDNLPELGAIINYQKAVYPIISLDRAEIKPGTNYEVQYSQTNSRLLNVPYNTDCRDYEIEVPYKSNYECIDDCLTKHMLEDCKCIFNKSRGDRVTKWPAADSKEINYTFCKEEHNTNDICKSNQLFTEKYRNSECRLHKKCKNNCFEEYFRYEVKQLFWDAEIDGEGLPENEDEQYFYAKGGPEYEKVKQNYTTATLRIRRKDEPDTTYEHTADMIFVEFVCYFGGLLGLWLGVSMLDVYHQCVIWYGQAPGAYQVWYEKQKVQSDVREIRVDPNYGRVSVVNSDKKLSQEENNYNYNYNYNNPNNVRDIYNTQYSTFNTQFN